MFRLQKRRKCSRVLLSLALLLALASQALAAGKTVMGPVLENYGPVFPGHGKGFDYDRGQPMRAVFDVAASPQDPAERNRRIESLARLLNLSARDGVDPGQIELAAVVHGAATLNLLTDQAYQQRHGMANPNRGLIEALANAGAVFYLCGQSASARGVAAEELLPQVIVAPSAMTAQVVLQRRGYAVMP